MATREFRSKLNWGTPLMVNLKEHHDMRRGARQPCDQTISVMWREAGEDRFAQARGQNISEWGLRFEISRPLPHQMPVSLAAPKLGLAGPACVRHCARMRNTNFAVGVEFASGLRWRQKD